MPRTAAGPVLRADHAPGHDRAGRRHCGGPCLAPGTRPRRDSRQGLNYAIYQDRYQRTPDEVRYLDASPLAGTAPRPAAATADPPAGNEAAAEGGR